MTRTLSALAIAAAVATTGASMATAMDMEFNMLTGAVFNELKSRGLPTDNIDQLSLSQIAIIKGIVDGDDSEGTKTNRIQAILERDG
ncbi:MAG: hypothetical protein HKO95_12735 [Rhodobacteraceae bacterium]|jgi:hypothetical protein|nr:hypothetical protein [Alphaproteobacteria bacterium]NNF71863.1 hypothetical protein [Paracoccaceae bacterium]NNK67587.1 hypothetical protein [Paracoccaceae bacterium]